MLQLPSLFAEIGGAPKPRRIFFIHIMKTGGTTVREALAALYRPEQCLVDPRIPVDTQPRSAIASIRFIAGHHLACQAFEPRFRRFQKLVVLRDPLERFKSHYRFLHWLKQQDAITRPDVEAAVGCSVLDYFHSPHGRVLRHLSLWQLGLERAEFCADPHGRLDAVRRGLHPPFDVLAARAKTRLDQCFVAIQEELPLSMRLLTDTFLDARALPAGRLNETPSEFRGKSEQLSAADMAEMRQVLEPDYEVYEYARARFRVQLAASGKFAGRRFLARAERAADLQPAEGAPFVPG